MDADMDADVDADTDADADVDPDWLDEDRDNWFGQDDCDDLDPEVHPGAPERCDGIDNDCDGLIDNANPGTFFLWVDADGDGHGDPLQGDYYEIDDTCAIPSDLVSGEGDCDDGDPEVHPLALDDTCDGVDQDCDGWPDDDAPSNDRWSRDDDDDGFTSWPVRRCQQPGDVPPGDSIDCNDDDPSVFPGAEDVWNDGIDQDCSGTDERAPDADGDGFDALEDCDDLTVSIHPEATEACGNNVDDDCDGEIDEGSCEAGPNGSVEASGGCRVLPWGRASGARWLRGLGRR